MVKQNGGVVWCFKDNQWVPLQLSSIRLHGVLTQAHWAALSDFLERVANKQMILQDNSFTELTDKHRELLLLNNSDNSNVIQQLTDSCTSTSNNIERKTSLSQIPEERVVVELPRKTSMPELRSLNDSNRSKENDELVLKLLKKYCKYNKDSLDGEILSAIERMPDEAEAPPRVRKLGYVPKEEKIYENLNELILDSLEDSKNEHVIRWLKQQNHQGKISFADTPRRHSSAELPLPAALSSPTDSRKSLVSDRKSSSSGFESGSIPESRKSSWCCESTLTISRKSSVGSASSCSECEEADAQKQWQRFLRRHLNSKNSEKRLRKQWEAWARNRRRLSLQAEPTWSESQLDSQP